MSVDIKFSPRLLSIKERLKRLPLYCGTAIDSQVKYKALEIVETFKDGIRKNNFRLTPLKDPKYIAKKASLGFKKPKVPLYGLGDFSIDGRSYIKMMRIKKLKKKYRIYPSKKMHHNIGNKSKIRLSDLFMVHEFGTIIKRGDSSIRIPPRPAFYRAYVRWLRKFKKLDMAKEMQQAISMYIQNGEKKYFDIMNKKTIPNAKSKEVFRSE